MSRVLTLGGATCALVIATSVAAALAPAAHADGGKKKSVADCTSFDQKDNGDDGVALTVASVCTVPLTCKMSWTVVCAPDSKKRRSVKPGSMQFDLATGDSHDTAVSAAACGDDAWTIKDITWTCAPAE